MKYIFRNSFYGAAFSLVDLLGRIAVSPARFLNPKEAPAFARNILVIRLDHIGDVVLSGAMAQNLKTHYKGAKLTFLVSGAGRDLLEGNPFIDEFICYDAPWFKRGRKSVFGLDGFRALAKRLKNARFDLGMDPRGDLRHILLMRLAGIRYKAGYGITGGGFLLDLEAGYKQGLHAMERNLQLLGPLGVKIVPLAPLLYEKSQDRAFVEDFFKKNRIVDRDFKVALHLSAGNPAKNWLEPRSAELIKRLAVDFKARIIVIGAEADKTKNENIINASGAEVVNASGQIPLGKLFALLKRVDLFIGLDSGPAHIAAAAGTPTVVLYSGTNRAAEWSPVGSRVAVIQKDTQCRGCGKTECDNNICMSLISTEEVMSTVKRLLKP